ncbi:hypothetical protein BGZ76_002225 [Entomortierella beljakovae]|nr:hypothetical protein BGZ76_002225 [Entomortierella beljakovae]
MDSAVTDDKSMVPIKALVDPQRTNSAWLSNDLESVNFGTNSHTSYEGLTFPSPSWPEMIHTGPMSYLKCQSLPPHNVSMKSVSSATSLKRAATEIADDSYIPEERGTDATSKEARSRSSKIGTGSEKDFDTR